MNDHDHHRSEIQRPQANRVVSVLWPAFLVAGVLEILLFACWDPLDLHWFGRSVEWSRDTVYSMSFFVLWGANSLSAWLTLMLCEGRNPTTHGVALNGDPVNGHGSSNRPGP